MKCGHNYSYSGGGIHEEPGHEKEADAEQSDGQVGVDCWVHRTDVPHH